MRSHPTHLDAEEGAQQMSTHVHGGQEVAKVVVHKGYREVAVLSFQVHLSGHQGKHADQETRESGKGAEFSGWGIRSSLE